MTESISSSTNVSLSVLSDIKSFMRTGSIKSENPDNTEEENKVSDNSNRQVTRKALSELLERSYNSNLERAERNAEEKAQKDANTTDPLNVNTSNRDAQSALSIKRPESDPELETLMANVSAQQTQPALEINRPEVSPESNPLRVNRPDKETLTKPASSDLPKQKNAILYELRNSMHLKYSAWDIAKKYGISYLEAQEIFIDLNRDANGVVKEFNLPNNSTVSYLV